MPKIFLPLFFISLFSFFPHITEAKEYKTIGETRVIDARFEDTLVDLAVEHHIGYVELLAANPGVDPWVPGKGTKLTLPKMHLIPDAPQEGLIINLAELRLYYFPKDGSEPITFPIGIGREGFDTPSGKTTIRNKVDGPKWRPTARMRKENPDLPVVVESGPDNPLGSHALYLGWPSYLIHGTQKPRGIGRRVSSGCIRMYGDHIQWLYENVPVDTPVRVINEDIKMGWIDDELYIEAQPADIQVDEIEYQGKIETIDIPDGIFKEIEKKAGDQAKRIDWEKVRTILVERTGTPEKITLLTP